MRLTGDGRPLRVLLMLLLLWTGARIGWPGAAVTQSPAASAPVLIAPSQIWPSARAAEPAIVPAAITRNAVIPRRAVPLRWPGSSKVVEDQPVDLMDFVRFAMAFADRELPHLRQTKARVVAIPTGPGTLSPLVATATPDRWSASAWMLWRDGSHSAAAAPAGRLGGSQAGLRVDYDLMPTATMRLSAYARASTAFDRPASPESAVGLAWQLSRTIPVTLAGERRVARGQGGRNANALFIAGGIGSQKIGQSATLEGYAQAGLVGFRSTDGFVDGKASLSWRLPRGDIRPGISLSGGAQPGLSRLDLGPELHLPIRLGSAGVRVGAEWRQRIAGNAAPGSGLTLTIAANF